MAYSNSYKCIAKENLATIHILTVNKQVNTECKIIYILDNLKIGNSKRKNRDHKKHLNKMKILVTCKLYYI